MTATGLPEGASVTPLILSGETDTGMLVVSASEHTKSSTGDIDIIGTATINGQKETRKARFSTSSGGISFRITSAFVRG